MLIGLNPLLTADLLHALAAMGHGDRIAIVDANYPASQGRRLIGLAGADAPAVLRAVLSVMPLDSFTAEPAAVMGDPRKSQEVVDVLREMKAVLAEVGVSKVAALERHAFYAAAASCYAIVHTGERRFYGNILLTKGVVPPDASQP